VGALAGAIGRALACALTVAVAAAAPACANADAPVYGVNAQFLLPNQSPSRWPVHLDAMARDGIAVVRSDAEWGTAEPRPPVMGKRTFDWRKYDVTVAELAKRGLRWLPIADYAAWWDRAVPLVDHSPPADIKLYAGYAAALAARYGPGGTFWQAHSELRPVPIDAIEAWNEPDSASYWVPKPSPARYADLYLATRGAVHAAAPDVQVLVGGLTRDPPGFVRGMVQGRPAVRGALDGVGIHPYAASPATVMERIVGLRTTLNDLGLGSVPIDVTEVGWHTRGLPLSSDVPDAIRGQAYAQLVETLPTSGCGVERFVPHTWVTDERNPLDAEDWFGITHPDGRASQTATAYAAAIGRVRSGAAAPAALPSCPAGAMPAVGAGAWMGIAPYRRPDAYE
jgi:hypothetical protein